MHSAPRAARDHPHRQTMAKTTSKATVTASCSPGNHERRRRWAFVGRAILGCVRSSGGLFCGRSVMVYRNIGRGAGLRSRNVRNARVPKVRHPERRLHSSAPVPHPPKIVVAAPPSSMPNLQAPYDSAPSSRAEPVLHPRLPRVDVVGAGLRRHPAGRPTVSSRRRAGGSRSRPAGASNVATYLSLGYAALFAVAFADRLLLRDPAAASPPWRCPAGRGARSSTAWPGRSAAGRC